MAPKKKRKRDGPGTVDPDDLPWKKRKPSRRGKGGMTKQRNKERMVNFQMQTSPDMVVVKAVLVATLKSLGWSDEQFQPLEDLLDDVHKLREAVAAAEPSDADEADKLHPALKALPKPILRAFYRVTYEFMNVQSVCQSQRHCPTTSSRIC